MIYFFLGVLTGYVIPMLIKAHKERKESGRKLTVKEYRLEEIKKRLK